MKKYFIAFFLLAYSVFPVCADNIKPGKTVLEVKAGESVTIELEANFTTGYSWIINNLADLTKLSLVSDYYEVAETDESLAGAGGKQFFTFKADKGLKGKEEVHCAYLRVWEKGVTPIEERVFEITVK